MQQQLLRLQLNEKFCASSDGRTASKHSVQSVSASHSLKRALHPLLVICIGYAHVLLAGLEKSVLLVLRILVVLHAQMI